MLTERPDRPFSFDEIIDGLGAGEDRTISALTYLRDRGILEQKPGSTKWRVRDEAIPAIEEMLSLIEIVKKRPSVSILRGFLSFRPFRMGAFFGLAKKHGFTRNRVIHLLNRERNRGHLREAVILLLGLQMSHLDSFRFYRRVTFVSPDEFRSFKATCKAKGLDFVEEEFLVGQYPHAIAQRAQGRMERDYHRSLMVNPSTWFFLQEFRKRIIRQPENPVYGICH